MTRARNSANLASHGNLFVDITNDRTGIGSVVPAQNLHVAGTAGFHADVTFTGDLYNTTWDRSDNSLKFVDNAELRLGDSDDLRIFHDGNLSRIRDQGTGILLIEGNLIQLGSVSNGNPLLQARDALGVELYFANSKKFETTAYGTNTTGTAVNDGLVVAGVATVTTMNVTGVLTYDDVTSVDSVGIVTARAGIHCSTDGVANGLRIGAGQDLIIQHNGTDSFVDNNTGDLYIQTTGSGDDILIESADDFFIKTAGTQRVKIEQTGDIKLGSGGDLTNHVGSRQRVAILGSSNGSMLHIRGGSPAIYFDQSGGNISKIYQDNVNLAFHAGRPDSEGTNTFLLTSAGAATFAGIVQATQFKLLDNAKAVYGNSGDMEIYHNATNSLIQNGTGTLQIVTSSDLYQQAASNISFNTGGSNERLRITSTGEVGISPGGVTPTAGDLQTGDSQNKPLIHVKGTGVSGTGGEYNLLGRFEAGGDADNTGAMVVLNHSNDRGLAIIGGRANGNRAFSALKSIDNAGRLTNAMVIGGGNGQGVDYIALYTGESTSTTERLRITSGGSVNIGGDYTQTSSKLKVTGTVTVDGGFALSAGTFTAPGGFSINSGNVIISGDIAHDADSDTTFGFGAGADTFRVQTAGSEQLRITSQGRIGLNGVVPTSSHANVTSSIHLADSNTILSRTGNQYFALYQNLKQTSADVTRYLVDGYASAYAQHTGTHRFYTVGNGTGNTNATVTERLRIGNSGQIGLGGANYGSSGQVLTSGGSGSAVSWTTITGTTINNNADNRVITGSGTANTLNGESKLTFDGTNLRLDHGDTVDGFMGEAYNTYFGLKHSDQTLNTEYMIISKDTDTFISASSGSKVRIRAGGNSSDYELQIGSGNDALTWRGFKVWHENNDGGGSGLDADTLDGISSGQFLRSDASDVMLGDFTIGNGTGQTNLNIKKADNNVADHIKFYNGTTLVGTIGVLDNSWLRLNQEVGANIYTPNYMRADAGFFVDGTSKGINGSGNFIGGTIAGASDYGTLVRSNASDTLTGGTYTFSSTTDQKIILSGSSNPYIRWREGTTDRAYIQFHSNGNFYFVNQESGEQLLIGSGSSGLKFVESGNTRTVWHSGNDGSGSSLDADRVDGLEASQFLRSDTNDTLTKGSLTTYSGGWNDWLVRFQNTNSTNAYVYMAHHNYGMHVRNDSSGTGHYLFDVYSSSGNRFQVRGNDARTTLSGTYMLQTGLIHFDVKLTSGTSSGDIKFNSVLENVGSHYSTSTGRFTAPVAGVYHFAGTVLQTNSGGQFDVNLRYNGSSGTKGNSMRATFTGHSTIQISETLKMNANDYVHINVSSGSLHHDGSGAWCGFQGTLLG